MPRLKFRHALVAVLLAVAMLAQGTWALAGTTGGLAGTVVAADTNAPLANAKVTVSSPSETTSISTDASGRFNFLSLIPDTYTVSVDKEGYTPVSQPGVSVFADAVQQLALRAEPALKTIAKVTSRASSSLVHPGTTADVYSVNASTQDKINALGGGGSLNSAYSAVASVPGAFVPLNQTGYYQTVHIRGGDYDQVGYELDGVPVNRSFDNYPSGALSSLGQQEVQIYTGAAPSNSEGQGLAGYINQVIKTGTFPGFGTGQLGIGSPTFYHKASAEVGGATPDRNFSYYVGLGGYNQEFRYVDNTNGAGYSGIGAPLQELGDPNNCASAITGYSSCYANGTAGPGGFAMAGPNVPGLSSISDRDVIANVHFGLPHKHDGGKDDVQLLWDSGSLANYFYFSTNDQGGAAYLNNIGLGAPTYTDGYQWNGPVGVLLPSNYQGDVSQYFFPQARQHPFGSEIPANERDSTVNNQEIFKAQYQKNFGSSAYLRLYGYTYYSNWLQYGPQTTYSNYVGAASPDYELSSHTRGVSGTFADQINQQNLITLQASYTTANSIRDNNTQMYNGGGKRGRGIVLVNANDPLSGLCYDATGTAQSCDPAVNAAAFATWKQAYKGTIAAPPAAGVTCGGGPCAWLVAENSLYATYNTVVPKFTSYSLTDQWRPTDKLLFNVGVRLDGYQFDGSSTNANDPARAFWFRAFNMDKCVQASTGRLFDKSGNFGVSPTTACSSIPDPVTSQVGGFAAPNMVNSSAQVESYHEFQPRISGTYTFNPDNVVRFSYGKYAEPPNAAFEQYNSLQENLPAVLGAFVPFGFNTPGHTIVPATSQNADLSLEHHFKNTDWSFKLTPFLRKTKDQIQQFFLDQQSGFVSGLNVGRQTSEGVEFQLNKGDFSRNGLSGQLAFTYTHSQISYDRLANGNTVLAGINNDIDAFNKLTKAGGASQCYAPTLDPTTNALTGATAAACGTPGSYANPYYNAAPQGHISSDNVPTYDLLPGPIGASADAFGVPYFATFILNYKHDKFAITPTLQFAGGGRYGSPESNYGIDPTAGCTGLAGTNASNDPRYIYGGPNGTAGYDASSCLGVIPVPNTYTKQFDGLGAFVQPSQLVMNLQLSYDVSPKVQLIGTFANVVDSCFGGSKEAWTSTDRNYCAYGIVGAGAIPPVGNVYNPGAPIQQLVKYPYEAALGGVNVDGNSTKTPFNFFLEARIKL